MQYLIVFIEGIITFISPCMLPMLPIYLSYLAGGAKKGKTIVNSIGFVLGFSIIFVLLGAAAGTFGSFLADHTKAFNIAGGIILIIFGLAYADVLRLPMLNRIRNISIETKVIGFWSAVIFGMVFATCWTPCVGAFLGSALVLAANSQTTFSGIVMLLLYSLGLGIPFVMSALLLDQLEVAFDFIKKHYAVINIISGLLLIIMGVMMVFGFFNVIIGFLSF